MVEILINRLVWCYCDCDVGVGMGCDLLSYDLGCVVIVVVLCVLY